MVKGWFQQFLVNAAGPLVLLVVLVFLPESFRWYLSSGRIEEGIEALKVYGHSFLIVTLLGNISTITCAACGMLIVNITVQKCKMWCGIR